MLNLTEASAVNDVLRHLIGAARPGVDAPPSRQDAIEALATLTGSAFNRLGAGFSADCARDNLRACWPGAVRQVWMLEMHGRDPQPHATEHSARHKVATDGGWPADADMAWRASLAGTGFTPVSTLFVDGKRTLCFIWPATVHHDALSADTAAAQAPDEAIAACKVCGCTEDDPCEGGCAWVVDGSLAIDLCTACAFAIARDALKSRLYRPPLTRLTTEQAAAFDQGLDDIDSSSTFTMPSPDPVASPRFVAVARDIPDSDIRITVVDVADGSMKIQFLTDWDEWRPASAGHRLIERGWIVDPAAHYLPGTAAGWTELPGIGHVAPIRQIEERAE